MRLHGRERRQAVAQDGGALEIERDGGLFHLAGKFVLDRAAAAGKEGVGLPHQLCICVGAISSVQGAEQRLI